jgi:hypothetical protein
MFIINL